MVAYLTRVFGLASLELAEDVVQDTFCRAIELWPMHGVPANPSAWLFRVARNRAIDLLRRDRALAACEPELADLARLREETPEQAPDFEQAIQDDQLRMMFSCCHPELADETRVTLILKTLCGFSVAEIAAALLARPDAIEKRLGRARKLFRQAGAFEPLNQADEMPERLDAVCQAIYLLFNEGYHSSHSDLTVRAELCCEALRLALLLSQHPQGDRPRTHALLALLCFHAARLPGRLDAEGSLLQLQTQNRAQWDQALIARGMQHLAQSAQGRELSAFHLEAAIASLHSLAPSYAETDWGQILALYQVLYSLKPTPIVALNRAIAVGKALGPGAGLIELADLAASSDAAKLKDYPFLPAARAEFHLLAGQPEAAAAHFSQALALARSPAESQFFELRLSQLE